MAEFQLPHDHGTSFQAASLHQEVMQVAHFAAAAEVFKQLSDPTRVRIFWLLSHQEACVINLAAMLEMSSPAVSHHLRSLTESGLLISRRDGKEVYYRAADTEESRLLHEIVERVRRSPVRRRPWTFRPRRRRYPPRAHLSHGASFRAHHDRGTVTRVPDEYNDAEKRLKRVYGSSIAQHMKQHRMEAAAARLTQTQDDIAAIAKAVGYESQSRFTEAFREVYGEVPTEYRKRRCRTAENGAACCSCGKCGK